MKRNLLCLVNAFAMGSFTASAQPEPDFHAARSGAEKVLDSILKSANNDLHQLDNLFGGRGNKIFRPTYDYSTVLTQGLIAAMAAAEAELVQKNCAGVYRDEVCGLDYSPITCTQDFDLLYRYRTNSEGRLDANISYFWGNGTEPVATYRLIRQDRRWKIDAITCDPSGVKFQPAPPPPPVRRR